MEFRKADIFGLPVEALVNPVNSVGVMGKGLAAAFRARFALDPAYTNACRQGALRPGGVLPIRVSGRHKWVLCAATKDNWRHPSQLSWVEKLISESLPQAIAECGITTIAIPALGCGLGGLDWKEVRALFEKHSEKYPEKTIILLPEE